MRRLSASYLALFGLALGGCTFTYGTVYSPPGKTAEQRSLAILVGKDEAAQANAGGPAAAEYLLGATIVGAPAGVQMEIDTKRAVFIECMRKRGYEVRPPT